MPLLAGHRVLVTGAAPVASAPCEKHHRTRRRARGCPGQEAREAVGHRRRGRVRSRHRPGVPQDRQRGPPARLPCRQGAAQGARGAASVECGARAGAARLGAGLPVERRARARRRPDRHPGDRDHRRRRRGPVAFDATCEVRPEIAVDGYGGLRVELPALEPSQEDVEEAIDTEVRRHGSLADVDRPVQSGDQVTLTLSAERDGEPVVGLNTEDWLYEVGQGWVAPGFDGELLGAVRRRRAALHRRPQRHQRRGRLHRARPAGARGRAAQGDRRVGRREHRRARHGRVLAGGGHRTPRHPAAQPGPRTRSSIATTEALVELVRDGRARSRWSARPVGPGAEHVAALPEPGRRVRAVAAGHRAGPRPVRRVDARAVRARLQARPRPARRGPVGVARGQRRRRQRRVRPDRPAGRPEGAPPCARPTRPRTRSAS